VESAATAQQLVAAYAVLQFKELAEQTRGISKGAAAIGITGFKKALAVLIKRYLHYADSLEEAKEWLAEQAKK
jgi:hypothetical protein